MTTQNEMPLCKLCGHPMPAGDVGEALIGLNKLHFNKPSGCPEDIGDDDGVDLEQLDSWFNTHYHTIKRALSQLTKAPKNVTCGDVSNGALLNSEQILIDALKFYAAKEHWMANTENGQPFTLCALKHALDYAGWVHAHGQLQRWAIVKHFESEHALSQQPDAGCTHGCTAPCGYVDKCARCGKDLKEWENKIRAQPQPIKSYNYCSALLAIEFVEFEGDFIHLRSQDGFNFKVSFPHNPQPIDIEEIKREVLNSNGTSNIATQHRIIEAIDHLASRGYLRTNKEKNHE